MPREVDPEAGRAMANASRRLLDQFEEGVVASSRFQGKEGVDTLLAHAQQGLLTKEEEAHLMDMVMLLPPDQRPRVERILRDRGYLND